MVVVLTISTILQTISSVVRFSDGQMLILTVFMISSRLWCRSQWPRSLTHEPSSARLNTGIVSSNPTQGRDICVWMEGRKEGRKGERTDGGMDRLWYVYVRTECV
jgi:hypothetical protein